MNASATRLIAAEHSRPRAAIVGLAALFALLSASCCVLPTGLSIIGLGGAWLAVLRPFVTYRPAMLVLVSLVVLWAWVRLLKPSGCARRRRLDTVLATVATLSFFIAVSSPIWEDELARVMWLLWMDTQ